MKFASHRASVAVLSIASLGGFTAHAQTAQPAPGGVSPSLPPAHRSVSDKANLLTEQRARLLETIALLKGEGVPLEYRRGFTYGADAANIGMLIVPHPKWQKAPFEMVTIDHLSPWHFLERVFSSQLQPIPSALSLPRESGQKGISVVRISNALDAATPIVPFTLSSSPRDGKIQVTVSDILLGETVFVTTLNAGGPMLLPESPEIDSIRDTLLKETESRHKRHQEIVQSISAAETTRPEVISFSSDDKMSEKDRETIRSIEGAGWSLGMALIPEGGLEDQPLKVPLSVAALEAAEWGRLHVHGRVIAFWLSRAEPKVLLKESRPRPMSPPPTLDKYGNTWEVSSYVTSWGEDGQRWEQTTKVHTALPTLSGNRDSANQEAPLMLDLKSVGFETISTLLSHQRLYSLPLIGGCEILIQSPPESFPPELKERLESAISGAQEIEKLYGFPPQSIVRQVVILDTDHVNAMANGLGRITFYDEILRSYTDPARGNQAMRTLGRHEALHGVSLRGFWVNGAEPLSSALQRVYDEAPRPILRRLDEGIFLEQIGGHSYENAEELLATLMAGLTTNDADWESRISSKDVTFRELVHQAASAHLASLSAAGIPESAPVRELLKRRLAFLEHLSR